MVETVKFRGKAQVVGVGAEFHMELVSEDNSIPWGGDDVGQSFDVTIARVAPNPDAIIEGVMSEPSVLIGTTWENCSGSDNIFIGYEAGTHCVGIGPDTERRWAAQVQAQDDAPDFWHCAYCGQSNAAERGGCRGCLAPRPGVT